VRLTPDSAPAESDAARRAALRQRTEAVLALDAAPRAALRQRAAAAAVPVLLTGSTPTPGPLPPPTATVSPWQAAMRANRLRQRGPR